jgi:hypothetical protein
MSCLTEIAEEYGLASPEAISQTVPRLSVKRFFKVVEKTLEAVATDEGGPANPTAGRLNLLASSSIRSDAGCHEWRCRNEKLSSLARYAALYSDGIIVPHAFANFTAGPEAGRLSLADLYFKHYALRPLVEAGIAKFAIDLYCLCEECGRRFRKACAIHDRAAFELYMRKLPEMNVIYRPPSKRRSWFLEIRGPEDYVPHGELRLVPSHGKDAPGWAPRRIGLVDGAPGAALTAARIRKHRLGGRLFEQFSEDAMFQQYHGVRFGASFITDSLTEAEFLDTVYPRNDINQNVRTLLSALTDGLPLLADVPLRTVLKIRNNDYDSFQIYRNALRDVLANHVKPGKALSRAEAEQICSDVVAPQLAKLRIDANAKRRAILKKSLAKSVVPVAMVSIGVIAGLIPHELAEIFKWGGIALSGQIAEALASIEKNPNELRSHNFYFLYRLAQAAE